MRDRKTRVLVVDDEESYTKLLKLNLEQRRDYEVLCENDSRHAPEAAMEFLPDIILLDVVMPGADGGDVVHELQQNPRLKKIPVVFVTALVDSNETKGRVVTMQGGEEMLGKPFHLDTLCQCIDDHVAMAS